MEKRGRVWRRGNEGAEEKSSRGETGALMRRACVCEKKRSIGEGSEGGDEGAGLKKTVVNCFALLSLVL